MEKDYQKLIHGTSKYEDYFVINWCFFSICNFSCSYCPTSLHDGKNRGLDIETVKKFCLKVIEEKKDKKIFFEFTGGEITYYRNFVELFEFLKQHGAETGMISNGSRDLAFWEKHKHLFDHICLSFHPEQGDPDHFFEVVKLLNHRSTVHVNIMMLPSKFDLLYGLAQRISSEIEGISVAIQALFENMSGSIFTYTSEQKHLLDNPNLPWGQNIKYNSAPDKVKKVYRGEMKKVYQNGSTEVANPPELIAKGENTWTGWDCSIGIENIVIDFHGNIYRGWCMVGGKIGNVADPHFSIPTDTISCSAKMCYCGLDIMATKSKKISNVL